MTLLGWFSCIFMLTGSFVKEKTNKKIINLVPRVLSLPPSRR